MDELLDRAVAAINRGDRMAASALAGQVLVVDRGNAEAEVLLTAPGEGGEIRRLTILFADLLGSTALSTPQHQVAVAAQPPSGSSPAPPTVDDSCSPGLADPLM